MRLKAMSKTNPEYIGNRSGVFGPGFIPLLYFLICLAGIRFFDGTGDSGDSVLHYLFAHYAPKHPALYFDHWAKPVFVLLASPFAQFGFMGIKLFNALASTLTLWLTYKSAIELKMKSPVVVMLLFIFAPLQYILTLSGFTEPLFALFVSLALLLTLRGKLNGAAVVLSFLPYVRSEGLIVAGTFALYFAYRRQYKIIPLLAIGSIVYAIAGYIVHGSLLWVFTKIPYASAGSKYGSGEMYHFAISLVNVLGVPVYALMGLGIISTLISVLGKKTYRLEDWLVFCCFLFFFVAHSLFWFLGIFNSMGLNRVFVGIMPFMVLLALRGYNFLTAIPIKNMLLMRGVKGTILLYVAVFPFTANPSAIVWDKDLMLLPQQKLAKQTAEYVSSQRTPDTKFFFSNHYLGMLLNVDRFDSRQHPDINTNNLAHIKSGDMVIWDPWYSGFEAGMDRRVFDNDTNFVTTYIASDNKDNLFVVYKRK